MKSKHQPRYEDEQDDEQFYEDLEDYENEVNDQDELQSLSFGALSKAQDDLEDDSDSAPEGASSKPRRTGGNQIQGSFKKRKHAPSEVSAKKPVSVIREVPGLKKDHHQSLYRDIRFDPAYGRADLHKTRSNYAFLNDYREKELQEMKIQLKSTRDDRERARISAAITSLGSRLKTLKDRDFEHKALQKAKKEVPKGKYMTRKDKREFVLKEKYGTMKKKDIERALERRRKKVTARERKSMPERRSYENES